MKAVIDTNIFISGIFWKGSPNKVLELWKEGKFTNITSVKIVEEINRVLNDFDIKLSEELIREWIDLIVSNSTVVETKEEVKVVRDETDNIFIEAAIAGNAEYIISGDHDLQTMKKYRGIKIVSPAEFLRINLKKK